MQQAEKDYRIAEFYRRDGHSPSAYFYYEIVRRRYPGTKFADLATDRMHELQAKMEKQGVTIPAPSSPTSYLPNAPIQRETSPKKREGTDTLPAPRKLPDQMDTAPRPMPGQQ
jgi:hypothetical protein